MRRSMVARLVVLGSLVLALGACDDEEEDINLSPCAGEAPTCCQGDVFASADCTASGWVCPIGQIGNDCVGDSRVGDSAGPDVSDADDGTDDSSQDTTMACDAIAVACCQGDVELTAECIDGDLVCPDGFTKSFPGGCMGDVSPDATDSTDMEDVAGNALGEACGGMAGPCDETGWCDRTDNACSVDDGTGTCVARPGGCDDFVEEVCGCDGQVYSNACEAESAGVDVSLNGNCSPPGGTFACGDHFCDIRIEYCQRSTSDVGGFADTYSCMPMPSACAGQTPDCTCLAGEPCASLCDADANGNLTLTCPGG